MINYSISTCKDRGECVKYLFWDEKREGGCNNGFQELKVTVELLGKVIGQTAREGSSDSTSYFNLFVWPASIVLSCFILYKRQIFQDKHVLEIGAGQALCSLVSRKIGAGSTIATDFHSSEANGVQKLRWGEFDNAAIELLCNKGKYFDIILGSDLFYEENGQTETETEENIDGTLSMISLAARYNADLLFITAVVNRSFDQLIRLSQSLRNWKLKILEQHESETFMRNPDQSQRNVTVFVIGRS